MSCEILCDFELRNSRLKNGLAFKLWELANLTVAFCVAQVMTFFYLAADNKLEELFKTTFAQWFAVTISLVGYGLYLAIIWGCQKGAKSLLSETWNDVEKIWSIATICRYLIILFFMVLSLVIYARLFHWI